MTEKTASQKGMRGREQGIHQTTLFDGVPESFVRVQEGYLTGATAIGAELFDFMRQRCDAYAQALGEFQGCKSPIDVWQRQCQFGQKTVKAYTDEVAKLGALAMQAANGDATHESSSS